MITILGPAVTGHFLHPLDTKISLSSPFSIRIKWHELYPAIQEPMESDVGLSELSRKVSLYLNVEAMNQPKSERDLINYNGGCAMI